MPNDSGDELVRHIRELSHAVNRGELRFSDLHLPAKFAVAFVLNWDNVFGGNSFSKSEAMSHLDSRWLRAIQTVKSTWR